MQYNDGFLTRLEEICGFWRYISARIGYPFSYALTLERTDERSFRAAQFDEHDTASSLQLSPSLRFLVDLVILLYLRKTVTLRGDRLFVSCPVRTLS